MNFRFRTFALAAVIFSAAGVLAAQETPTAGRTHTVKKGDTLWDIARLYLNDPFLWPEVYRLNTSVVEDPHWIYPGEALHIPDGAVSVAQDQIDMAPTKPVSQPSTPGFSAGPTIFTPGARRPGARALGLPASHPYTAVRPGEFYGSPWVDHLGGPPTQGNLVAVAELPGTNTQTPETRITNGARAYITLPKDVVPAKGDRFLTFSMSTQIGADAQVMIPTGIIEVERAENGDATTVRVVEQYAAIDVGNGVIPIEKFSMTPEARPAPLDLGPETKVVYIEEYPVLPTIGRYLVMSATAKDGVKIGDQFTLYRPRVHLDNNVVLPEEKIALVQVTRVTDMGVAGMIVDQRQPAIHEGASARLTARMP